MDFQLTLKRVISELLVLQLLEESDLCCDQCIRKIKGRSKGEIVVTESLLYPILQHMAQSGCLTWYGEKGRHHQVFHLEDPGRAYFQKAVQDYFSMSHEVARFLGRTISDPSA